MNEERLERLVRAAVRGIMEAVLSYDAPVYRDKQPRKQRKPSQPEAQEITFPSVTRYEQDLFGDMPTDNADIDMAVDALNRARELESRKHVGYVQPGPGESEDSNQWGVPQV